MPWLANRIPSKELPMRLPSIPLLALLLVHGPLLAANGIAVTVEKVEAQPVEVTLEALGHVEAPASLALGAEAEGRLTSVRVDVGDRVRAGQLLAEIDTTALRLKRDAARAELERLAAQVAQQAREVERQRSLLAQKLVAQSVFDAAEAGLTALRASQLAARRQLELAEDQLERGDMRAHADLPGEARVDARLLAAGDYVKLGQTVFQLSLGEGRRAVLTVPEAALASLRPGIETELELSVREGETVSSVITSIRPELSAGKAAEVRVPLPESNPWPSGSSVRARFILERHPQALTVPPEAVVRRPGREVVFVLDGDVVRERMVVPGVRRADAVEIVEGLDGNETVAVRGAGFLSDGAAVVVRD